MAVKKQIEIHVCNELRICLISIISALIVSGICLCRCKILLISSIKNVESHKTFIILLLELDIQWLLFSKVINIIIINTWPDRSVPNYIKSCNNWLHVLKSSHIHQISRFQHSSDRNTSQVRVGLNNCDAIVNHRRKILIYTQNTSPGPVGHGIKILSLKMVTSCCHPINGCRAPHLCQIVFHFIYDTLKSYLTHPFDEIGYLCKLCPDIINLKYLQISTCQ